jgi:hypothetical protein
MLVAGNTQSEENAAESHTSGARFIGWRLEILHYCRFAECFIVLAFMINNEPSISTVMSVPIANAIKKSAKDISPGRSE